MTESAKKKLIEIGMTLGYCEKILTDILKDHETNDNEIIYVLELIKNVFRGEDGSR